jgi:hypothetical protein
LNEDRALVNNMFAFKVNIEATIDISLLDASIQKIQEDSGLRNCQLLNGTIRDIIQQMIFLKLIIIQKP